VDDVPTAPVIVCIDERGERTFHYAEGANTQFDAHDLEDNMGALRRARAIVIGYLGELPRLDPQLPEVLRWLKRESQALIVLETAGPQVAQRALLADRLPHVDVFFPSWEEARELTGARTPQSALRGLAGLSPRTVLGIKLGSRGCLLWHNGHARHLPAFPVQALDATGAGDSFLAGFLAGLLHGCDLCTAARLGNLAGALTVAAPSGRGQQALPSYEQLLALIEGDMPPRDGRVPSHAEAATGAPARPAQDENERIAT
jgi:sugar/nucleoside kinase (ribokinase family)